VTRWRLYVVRLGRVIASLNIRWTGKAVVSVYPSMTSGFDFSHRFASELIEMSAYRVRPMHPLKTCRAQRPYKSSVDVSTRQGNVPAGQIHPAWYAALPQLQIRGTTHL